MDNSKINKYKFTPIQIVSIYLAAVMLGVCVTLFFTDKGSGSSALYVAGSALFGITSFLTGKSVYELVSDLK